MNANPSAKRILCFGDSNTWGYIPTTKQRYDVKTRWTGVLQIKLGENYEIIEEGFNGRTTTLDDPEVEGRNGKTYILPCIGTHEPLDLVILFLGTNDMKERFHRQPEEISAGIEELVKVIKNFDYHKPAKPPRILLTSPTLIDESVETVKEKYLGAEEKSRRLAKFYENVAQKHGLYFLDLSKVVFPSKKDGYHLDPEAHSTIADALYEKLVRILR